MATINLYDMPEPSDHYEPSEADLEMVIEETTGKPVKPASAAAGIASMRQRLKELEVEKAKLLNQMDTATGALEQSLNKHLASLNKDIAAARERLAHYESQLGQQN